MLRSLLIVFVFQWMLISCQSNTSKADSNAMAENTSVASPSPAVEFQMKPDTIEVRGKFLGGCTAPDIVKLREYNVMQSRWNNIPVNNGEFSFKFYLREPRQINFKTSRANFDFAVTTNEKIYDLEITCSGPGEIITVKNSDEGIAFQKFSDVNRDLRNKLTPFKDQPLSKTFPQVQPILKDYHAKVAAIGTAHPKTYTAQVLVAAENLPAGTLESAGATQKNYLQRQVLANPVFYNTFQSSRIFTNYMDFIINRESGDFSWYENVMSIAAKDPEAAKRLQQVLHDLFYYRHEEELLTEYIKWGEQNPAAMHNPSVKMRLQSMRRMIAGSPMMDIQLTGADQKPKKLSETVPTGKVTLLIFYSPTCSHCQEELPQLVPIWEKYKDKGLKIYAVAFDANDNEWRWFMKNKASEEWTHVFETSTGMPPSSQYVVNYTPTYVLIDSKGNIISRFATFDAVKQKIPKLLD